MTRIRTYTYRPSEFEQLMREMTMVADLSGVKPQRDEDGQIISPELPIQISAVRRGPKGKAWIRYVAEYEGSRPVGYATLGDLCSHHEFAADVCFDFQAFEQPEAAAGR